ncbi:MAG TPA: hypothetical protein PLR25_18305, partial [Planctomycetaceae bacterium]|nr:hypothetical protein [Planctomycetaceae bacterium]
MIVSEEKLCARQAPSTGPHPARLDGAKDGELAAPPRTERGPIQLVWMVNKIPAATSYDRLHHPHKADGVPNSGDRSVAVHLPLHPGELDGGDLAKQRRARQAPS